MIPDIEIHRCACLMIRHYGEGSTAQAAKRGNELLDRGDLDGMLVWLAVVQTIGARANAILRVPGARSNFLGS